MGQFFKENEQRQNSVADDLNEYMRTAELKKAAFLLIIFLSVGILVFIAAITEIPITRNSTGIISSDNGAVNIYSDKDVYRVYAYAGQNLKKDDRLLEYADGSFELMPEDGMLLEANRTKEGAGSGGKVISYLAAGGTKRIYCFLPTEMAMGVKNGQEVHLSHSKSNISTANDNNSYIGQVSYVNDNFFDMQEIQDFIGSANTTNLLVSDSADPNVLYRLIGVESPDYINFFTSDKGASYDDYIDSICNITVTVKKVSVLRYLFSW